MNNKFSISQIQDFFYCILDKHYPLEKKTAERKYKYMQRYLDTTDKKESNNSKPNSNTEEGSKVNGKQILNSS